MQRVLRVGCGCKLLVRVCVTGAGAWDVGCGSGVRIVGAGAWGVCSTQWARGRGVCVVGAGGVACGVSQWPIQERETRVKHEVVRSS